MVYLQRSIEMAAYIGRHRPSRRIAASVGLIVYLIGLSLGCSTPTPPRPVLVETLSIQDLYPEALQIAKAWKEDAYFTGAYTSFWPTDSNEFQYASFSFRSRATDFIGLYVSYDPATDSFEEKWLGVAEEDPRYKAEIADAEWRLDSIEALEIAQGAGGSEFLAGQLDKDLDLYLRLEKRQIGQDLRTVWRVAYYVGMPPSDSQWILIDAVTGEVLEADDESG